jgi:hypothetical protein
MVRAIHMPTRLLRSAALGGLVGVGLLAIGGMRYVVAVLAGRSMSAPSARDGALAAIYVLSFTIAGAVVEALGPLRRSRDGAMLAGIIGGIPVAIGMGLILSTLGRSGPSLWMAGGLLVLIMGPIVGWRDLHRPGTGDAARLPEPRLRTVRPSSSRAPDAGRDAAVDDGE